MCYLGLLQMQIRQLKKQNTYFCLNLPVISATYCKWQCKWSNFLNTPLPWHHHRKLCQMNWNSIQLVVWYNFWMKFYLRSDWHASLQKSDHEENQVKKPFYWAKQWTLYEEGRHWTVNTQRHTKCLPTSHPFERKSRKVFRENVLIGTA